MATSMELSDTQVLQLLRHQGPLGISEVAKASQVTATAVRQRLVRLMAQGLVQREATRAGRGRPSHRYSLTEKARRQSGGNFADLATVLWAEIREVKDIEVRRGLLQRIARAMSAMYTGAVHGVSVAARMESLKKLFGERHVSMEVAGDPSEPILKVLDCPYGDLAEMDRGVCAMERLLFSELLQSPVKLSECRLDGHACCHFEKAAV